MRCPYCNAENRDDSTFCISCGHALPAPSARTAAAPNYAFPHQGQADARMVGKGKLTLKSGIPLASGMSGIPLHAQPASPATKTTAEAAGMAEPAPAEAARIAPDPLIDSGRRTPYFDPAAFEAAAHPPSWHASGPAAGSKAARLILLLCMFGVGLLSGAAALWWLNNPGEIGQALSNLQAGRGLQAYLKAPETSVTVPEPKMPSPAMTVMPPEAKAPSPETPAAISAGELPYDGLAPSAGSATEPGNLSGSAPQPALAPPATPSQAATPRPDTATGGNPAAAAPAPSEEAKRAIPEPVAQTGIAEAKSPQKAESVPIPEASRARAAKPLKKRARDTGVSTRSDTATAGAQATPRSVVAGERSLTPLMIAQCESMSNLAERAQCKREVCRGKEGKNACPS